MSNFQDELLRLANEKLAMVSRNREALVTAWIAETGLLPSESCLCSQDEYRDGQLVTKVWVERLKPGNQSRPASREEP